MNSSDSLDVRSLTSIAIVSMISIMPLKLLYTKEINGHIQIDRKIIIA